MHQNDRVIIYIGGGLKKTSRFYIDALCSNKCLCGKPKQGARGRTKAHSFCPSCYGSLPIDVKSDLWLSVGLGYEEAVDAAIGLLKDD